MLTESKIQTEPRPAPRPHPAGNGVDEHPNQPKRPSWTKRVVIAILIILVAGAAYWGVKRRQATAGAPGGRAGGQQMVVPIVAGTVEEKDVPVYLNGLGTVQAFNTVTSHVQVDGILKKVAFKEGQDVKAGDVLAQIDAAPYQAALDQAIGKRGQDAALLTNSLADMKREEVLYAAKVDSEQVWETQRALTNQYDAAVKADDAAIVAARVNLAYTDVTSPIDGRTGIRQVDQGNVVHATDTGGLVVVTQLKPISVLFTLPEQDLEDIQKQLGAGKAELKVLAVGRDNTNVLGEGALAVIDNQIDPTTGTIRLKATFPNDNLGLWPGQFVNVRLLIMIQTNALTVPASAIQRGPDGAYVFVIGGGKPRTGGHGKNGGRPSADGASANAGSPAPDAAAPDVAPVAGGDAKSADGGKTNASGASPNGGQKMLTVKMQPVTVAPQIEAGQAMILSGLQKGERIVVDGQYKLQDGSSVKISTATNAPPANSGTPDSLQ
jgi:membrane fusion protein, multidrug efflux system